MKLLRKFSNLALFLALGLTAIASLQAQQPAKPSRAQAQKVAPIPARVWKSEMSGKQFRVWTESNRFHAEWVNIPSEFAAKGAYIRTVCQRAGEKWVGESQSYLPCSVPEGNKDRIVNFCHFTTGFEVDTLSASRIAGRGEAVHVSDCSKCQVVKEGWKPYEWVPLPPKTRTGHEIPQTH